MQHQHDASAVRPLLHFTLENFGEMRGRNVLRDIFLLTTTAMWCAKQGATDKVIHTQRQRIRWCFIGF